MKVCVIGGGASGLMAALNIKNDNNEVIILDKNEELGKKILVTGNGKCNLWNSNMDLSNYNSSTPELLNNIITNDLIDKTFTKLCYLFAMNEKNGYFYPFSNKAYNVRDILVNECIKKGVEIKTSYEVKTITKKDTFIINNEIECDKLIISTGGCSMPITGSDGSVFNLLKNMGHDIVKPLPSLVPLYANEPYLNKWNGIRCHAVVSSIIDGEVKKEEYGELQLTDNGISGVCVFNISGDIVRALEDNKNTSVSINFINYLECPSDYFKEQYSDLTVYDVLLKFLDTKLIKIILDKADINPDAYIKSLTTKELSRLDKYLTSFNINITGYGDFNKSQVTQGGISLKNINPDTLESNIVENLYLIGEVLDIDGICGGYNLGFAWMSAIKVSDNLC